MQGISVTVGISGFVSIAGHGRNILPLAEFRNRLFATNIRDAVDREARKQDRQVKLWR